jgi:hypothetical protein
MVLGSGPHWYHLLQDEPPETSIDTFTQTLSDTPWQAVTLLRHGWLLPFYAVNYPYGPGYYPLWNLVMTLLIGVALLLPSRQSAAMLAFRPGAQAPVPSFLLLAPTRRCKHMRDVAVLGLVWAVAVRGFVLTGAWAAEEPAR